MRLLFFPLFILPLFFIGDSINRGPCCERIDRAIRDWCLLPETEGDCSVLDCQYFLSARGTWLLDEFPDPDVTSNAFMNPWERIVEDVLDRLGEPMRPAEEEMAKHARAFMIRIIRRIDRTGRFYFGLGVLVTAMAMGLIKLATGCSLVVRMCVKIISEGEWLRGLFDGFLAVATWIGGLIVAAIMFTVGRRYEEVPYTSIRGELIKLLRVAPVCRNELKDVILAREDEKFGDNENIDDTDVVAKGIENDPATQLFCLAQISLRAATADGPLEAEVVYN